MIGWRLRRRLIFLGYSEDEILQLGDLDQINTEHMNKVNFSENREIISKAKPSPFSNPARIQTI